MTIFSVQAKLPPCQYIRLVGNIEELGKWSPFESVQLHSSSRDYSSARTWSVNIIIHSKQAISFRYFICEDVLGSAQNAFSIIKCGPLQELPVSEEVNSGILDINDATWCDGWLLYETEVHLAIHNANGFPFNLFYGKLSFEPDRYRVKVTVIDMDESKRCLSYRNPSDVNIKVVGEYHCDVKSQEESGISYDPSKHYSFITRVLDPKLMLFKIEIYLVEDLSEGKVKIMGHGFIQAVNLKDSCGIINVDLVHNESPIGSLQVEYLIIKPLDDKSLHNIEDWTNKNWQNSGRTLNMGHCGCGTTFSSAREGVQENTIESFLMAWEKGADGLELDVHLTKDFHPVIYHDLSVKVSLQTKNDTKCSRMIPVHQFTYQELQDLQIIHTSSPELNNELQDRNDTRRKFFPKLEEVLHALPEDFPLELEVKYLETEEDQEDDNFLDINIYVDTLLKAIFENIGKRKIVLMCFSPVVVQLFNRKQKKIHMKIGVSGETEKYPVYKDIRIRTVGKVIAFAESEKILGISCFCDHIIRDCSILNQIKKRDLVLSTWGEDNNRDEIREKQREMGINVLCFDRIHEARMK